MNKMLNACLGNLFEHYDTALFGFLSPFLAPLIFPDYDPLSALILTFAIMPIAMLARPLGSLVFGYVGDVYGRERALFLTLAGMAFVSGSIAFSPTYAQVGLLAPILFGLGRALQNFFAAGETMGGAIYILENTPERKHDILSGFYSASAMGGHLLASLAVFLLSYYGTLDPGWRILYLCGCVTLVFGCLVRLSSPPSISPKQKPSLWENRKPLLLIILCSGFAFATYSIALVLMNGLIPLITPITKTEIMKINTYLVVLDVLTLPLFGYLAMKVSREKLMLGVTLAALLLAIPLFSCLEGASLPTVIGVRIAFVLFGVAFFAPFHAWAQALVPPSSRYAVISLGYAVGSQLLGGPTAALALWSYQQTGLITSIAWYWMLLAFAASVALVISYKSKSLIEDLR